MGDAAGVFLGRIGKEVIGVAYLVSILGPKVLQNLDSGLIKDIPPASNDYRCWFHHAECVDSSKCDVPVGSVRFSRKPIFLNDQIKSITNRHGVCTVIFVMIAAVVIAMGASLQTLSKIGWLGWIGVFCIMSSVLTLSVAVGVTDRPAAAPQSGSFDKDVKMFGSPDFVSAMNAVNVILFAYAGSE